MIISGPDAENLARELAQRLHDELGGDFSPRLETAADSGEAQRIDPMTVAIASLVISIPSALLATVQLAERMKLVERWKALRAWAQQRLEDGQRVEISGDALAPKALTEAEPGEVIDAAIRAEQDDA